MSSNPNTSSFSISHADAHVTNEIIKYGSVDVKPMVDMWPSSVYNEKLKSDLKMLEHDSLLRLLHQNFLLNRTIMEGMNFLYRGGKTLKPGNFLPTKHLPAITGYFENIPDSSIDCFAEISVFQKTDICEFDRIMICMLNLCLVLLQFKNKRFFLWEVHRRNIKEEEFLFLQHRGKKTKTK